MKYRQSTLSTFFDILNHLILSLLILVILYPLIYVFSISISETKSVAEGTVKLFPIGFNLIAYETIFKTNDIIRSYINTIIYTVLGTFISLFFSSLTAYPLSQQRLKGRGIISFLFTLTMFISSGMIPGFLLIKSLGMYNTIWAIVVPPAFSMWNIIIIRTGFRSIPASIVESVYADGGSDWRVFFQFVLPLSKPVLAAIGLFVAVAQWNNFFGPLLFLADQKKFPLSLILRKVLIQADVLSSGFISVVSGTEDFRGPGFVKKVQMATIIAATGPIILAYPLLQKYFVKGIFIGSVKG